MLRAIRDWRLSRRAKAGGCCLAPGRCSSSARFIRSRERGGAYLLGLRAPEASFPHGGSAASQSAQAYPARRAGGRRRRVGATHAALDARNALARDAGVRIALYGCLAMTREEVFSADPVAPGRRARGRSRGIDESTALQGGPRGDSLDLYTLVQELEDSYGVKMTDEQAARILTVGQAVDFVVAHVPTT